MKTFKDLVFEEHQISKESKRYSNHKQAKLTFNNGYGISVVFGSAFYSNGLDNYEIAVLFDNNITYNTEITNDVIGYLTESEVSEIMIRIQELIN